MLGRGAEEKNGGVRLYVISQVSGHGHLLSGERWNRVKGLSGRPCFCPISPGPAPATPHVLSSSLFNGTADVHPVLAFCLFYSLNTERTPPKKNPPKNRHLSASNFVLKCVYRFIDSGTRRPQEDIVCTPAGGSGVEALGIYL